jgi:hypothetical protein
VYDRLQADSASIEAVRTALGAIPGVLSVYTRTDVTTNRFDDDPLGRRLARGYFAGRSADLMIVPRPY